MHRILASLCLFSVSMPPWAGRPDARGLVERTAISRGICSAPRCGNGELAMAIARASDLLVHAFDADRTDIDEAMVQAIEVIPGQ